MIDKHQLIPIVNQKSTVSGVFFILKQVQIFGRASA